MGAVDGKRELLWRIVLYRMLKRGESIPLDTDGTPYSFLEEDLRELYRQKLLEIRDENARTPPEKGEGVRDKMVAMYDQALKFESFGCLNLAKRFSESNDAKEIGKPELGDDGVGGAAHLPRLRARLDFFSLPEGALVVNRSFDDMQITRYDRSSSDVLYVWGSDYGYVREGYYHP